MLPSHKHLRINLTELKSQMVKKVGVERSKQYFYYLNRFLSLNLNKVEFNKFCLRILGRENILLHNQLMRSILRNASNAKTAPPPTHKNEVTKQSTKVIGKEISSDCGAHAGGLSNGGDILPVSPKKARSNVRDRRSAERRSALGHNGKITVAPQLSDTPSSDFNVILENGDLDRPKLSVVRSPNGLDHVNSKEKASSIVKNDGKRNYESSQLQAPLGIPFYSVSIGGDHRSLPLASSSACVGTSNEGALLDSLTLKEQMDRIALAQGLEGVSLDCANILNSGLQSYMKRLISSCVELVGTTSNNSHKHQNHMKSANGFTMGHQNRTSNTEAHLEGQGCKVERECSFSDFRVAMEMNPEQLSEDWPFWLEKISTCAFKE